MVGVRNAQRAVRPAGRLVRFGAVLVVTTVVLTLSVVLLGASRSPARADVALPSWWNGHVCDTGRYSGSHTLGASYLGVQACGPRPIADGTGDVAMVTFPGGWGEYEWECVELAMRFMNLVYGVKAYSANGNTVVSNYSTADGGGLVRYNNGTAGHAPQPGDIISYNGGSFGHVGVVTASSVDGNGNGSITTMNQNLDKANGWLTLSVSNWTVASYGNLTPYGWLHDPLGRGNPGGGGAPSDGTFVSYAGNVYRIAGGAPVYVSTWAPFGGPQPTVGLTDAQWAALRSVPADGTLVTGVQTGQVYRFAGGAPLYISTWNALGGTKPTIPVDQAALDNAGGSSVWSHVRYQPADGTFVTGGQTGQVYRFAGGAPLYVSTWNAFGGPQPTTVVDQAALDNAGGGGLWNHARYQPADGTFVTGEQTGQVYRFAGGAPLYVSTWNAFGGPQPTTVVDQADLDNAGSGGLWNHVRPVPADGTFLNGAQSGTAYRVAGGAALFITSWSLYGGTQPFTTVDQAAIDNAGGGSPWNHLHKLPADGTVLQGLPSDQYWLISGGARQPAPTTTGAIGVDDQAVAQIPLPSTRSEESAATYDGWQVFSDPTANGGTWRTSSTKGNAAAFTFKGSSVTWVSRKGPHQGKATVSIDGVAKGTVDLYSTTAAGFSQAYGGLSATRSHTITIKVAGTKNAASTGTGVVVDAFVVGTTTAQESDAKVKYESWKGGASSNASGGAYRSSGTAGATASFAFTGTSVDWITTTGPGWGEAEVYVDGVDKGTVDCYAAAAHWQTAKTYGGLASGTHTIAIKVLGKKNSLARATTIAIDAFVVH